LIPLGGKKAMTEKTERRLLEKRKESESSISIVSSE
jgi:hypothetical protein